MTNGRSWPTPEASCLTFGAHEFTREDSYALRGERRDDVGVRRYGLDRNTYLYDDVMRYLFMEKLTLRSCR